VVYGILCSPWWWEKVSGKHLVVPGRRSLWCYIWEFMDSLFSCV
jgi:hypothetical protein